MLKKTFKFIHNLKFFFLGFIVVIFLLVIGLNPIDISKFIGAKLGAAVGMSISVPENPFNKLALQLKEKEERLDLREQVLFKKEQALQNSPNQDTLIIFIAIGIGILFILILANYYFDYRRRKSATMQNK